MTPLQAAARQYLDGITKGDLAFATEGFADDAVLEIPFSSLPVSRVEGRQAIQNLMTPVIESMARRDWSNIRFIETGTNDLVLMDFECDFEQVQARGSYQNSYHCVIEGSGGKIVRWREYYDARIGDAVVGREAMNTAVVLDYATNFQKENSRTLVERVFHTDAEYLVNLPREQAPETIDAIPWSGLWKGHAAILEFEDIFEANWTVDEITPTDIIAKDDDVIVFGRMVLTAKATRKVADTPLMIRFTVEDGKIRKYHLMEDTYGVVLSHRSGGHFEVDNNGSKRQEPRPNAAA